MTRQRLLGIAALLGLGALMVGVPWLLIFVATRVRVRFDLTTLDGWWLALTRDDGTMLIWVVIVIGAIAWALLAIAILAEIAGRLRHVSVPRLPGLGVPQAIAQGLVAAAVGAWLAANTVASTAVPAVAAPGPVPVHTGGVPADVPASPQAPSDVVDEGADTTYVVKKGDTLWDIADEKLGDPFAYPEIYKASKHTVQPDGRRLVDPDLIYPGWELTIPTDEPERVGAPKRAARTEIPDAGAQTPVASTPTPAPPSTVPASDAPSMSTAPSAQPEPVMPVEDIEEPNDIDDRPPLPWMLAGISGVGSLLAGGLWLKLRRRRAVQYRYRRPGRTITVPVDPALAPVEKTLMHQGDVNSDLVQRIAETTQRLAASLNSAGEPIAALLGIDVTLEQLTFRFTDPAELPEPWEAVGDRREWRIRTDTDPDLIGPWDEENEPVWPTLVTLGQDAQGWRMVNLETLGVITLTGDRVNAEDLVRYWIAELSVAHWGRDLEIARGNLFEECASLIRQPFWDYQEDDVLGGLVSVATATDDYLDEYNLAGVDAGRAAQAGPELWRPRILLTADAPNRLDELSDIVSQHPGRTGVSLVRYRTDQAARAGTEIRVEATGRVQIPALGLDLIANGITEDEAAGCAALLDAADQPAEDAPVPDPAEPAAEWQQHCDASGHLHADLVVPRGTLLGALDTTSLLSEPDVVYITHTANTAEDLAQLAPLVPAKTTTTVKAADPTLDEDLADWRADAVDRPRIAVLGPVRVRLGRGGQPNAGIKRVAYYAEIAAYLATRPHGATTDELADALGVSADRVRVDLHTLRARLGTDPTTGRHFVPKAVDNPVAKARNEGVYLVEDLLCDADLFRRLRVRGEAAGSAGIDDLAAALRLVTGAPYEQLRRRGGLWLADTREDQHLLVGIIDVAHLVTTQALAAGDLTRARGAAELAHAIAPHEAIAQLDLAAIAEREGSPDNADQIAREVADWLDGTGDGPLDLSQRADTILRAHRWLERKDRVG